LGAVMPRKGALKNDSFKFQGRQQDPTSNVGAR
jgi:hypothetical protein